MNKMELLNKINESAYDVTRVRENLYHGKAYVVMGSYIKGIFKTKRGAEGYIKRNTGKSYYDESIQETVYENAGECFEVLENELINVNDNKEFWYKEIHKNLYNIKSGLSYNLVYEAQQAKVSDETMNYITDSINDILNGNGLAQLKVAEVETVQEPQQENDSTENTATQTANNKSIEFTVNEDINTKTNAKIFVAKLTKKIEYAEFKNIESKIKLIGGYYSRFKQGFIFNEDPTTLLQKEFNDNIEMIQPTHQPEILINEQLAQRAKENMSFDDYKEGSATKEYNNVVEDITKQINEAKEQVKDDSDKQLELDNLLYKFKKDYANWINKHNANGSSHVSWMISGRGNYNMNKHNRWESKEGKLWEEYNNIMAIDDKIDKVINSKKIIKSNDKNAIDKLKEKLEQEEKQHAEIKEYNKKARKENKEAYPTYMLSNSNQRIKNIKDRINQLEKLEELKTTKGNSEIEINNIKIIDNLETNRIQVVFPDKPDQEVRTLLKSNGFRWSPSFGAWQSYRGHEPFRKAKIIAESLINNNSIAV